MNLAHIIKGGLHEDSRGIVSFVNDFDLTSIKRFYQIKHDDTSVVRAWQGHQRESKWFYCVEGSFTINFIKPDNWETGSRNELAEAVILESKNPKVLCIPPQYATGIKANTEHSILMVYSDFTLEESKNDDLRFDINNWAFKAIV